MYLYLFQVEEEVASATSQFEELVLQYMDRIFTFIESVAQENVRIENNIHDDRNRVEKHLLILLESNYMTVFGQISPAILKVRVMKILDQHNKKKTFSEYFFEERRRF